MSTSDAATCNLQISLGPSHTQQCNYHCYYMFHTSRSYFCPVSCTQHRAHIHTAPIRRECCVRQCRGIQLSSALSVPSERRLISVRFSTADRLSLLSCSLSLLSHSSLISLSLLSLFSLSLPLSHLSVSLSLSPFSLSLSPSLHLSLSLLRCLCLSLSLSTQTFQMSLPYMLSYLHHQSTVLLYFSPP